MVTKKDKIDLINQLKAIDVKKLEHDHNDERITKWFRFGNYNALQIVTELIKNFPEEDESTVS